MTATEQPNKYLCIIQSAGNSHPHNDLILVCCCPSLGQPKEEKEEEWKKSQ